MSLRALLSKGYQHYQAIRYSRFNRPKSETKGMLSRLVYKRKYDAVYQLPDLDIIEVGGALGGGSITIASALRDSGKKSKLIVAEKCQGGSREDVGDYQTNLDVLKGNSEKFGVDASIVIYPKEVTFETGSEVLDLTTQSNLPDWSSMPMDGSTEIFSCFGRD